LRTNGGVKIGLGRGNNKTYKSLKTIILEYQKTIKK
jgi:hypothetical protein